MTGWLPAGVHELGHALAGDIDRHCCGADRVDADYWIDLPERVVTEPTRPDPPVVWGEGALCVDLGPDDHETWTTFSGIASDDLDPESVARRAQVWRLAVTPYRSVPMMRSEVRTESHQPVDLRGARVVDMTTMWAGPLCAELLGRCGASVTKIEPAARPDGLRFGDGDDGTGRAPMFEQLNGTKEFLDVDLRHCSDRAAFLRELRHADVLVTSLSPRAQSNLGLDPDELRAEFPDLCVVSITAFAANTPEADWIAYGTGVHALSGLGRVQGGWRSPAFSYPDPLAGLLACRVALAQFAGSAPPVVRVSLEEAIRPLYRCQP